MLGHALVFPPHARGQTLLSSHLWNRDIVICFVVVLAESTGEGRTHLPKLKFSAKFPVGSHVILKLKIKKFTIQLNQVRKLF